MFTVVSTVSMRECGGSKSTRRLGKAKTNWALEKCRLFSAMLELFELIGASRSLVTATTEAL